MKCTCCFNQVYVFKVVETGSKAYKGSKQKQHRSWQRQDLCCTSGIPTSERWNDVLRWVAPITITRKLIFGGTCNKELTCDKPVPHDVEKRQKDWTYILEQSKKTAVPKTAQTHAGSYFKLHGFSDASNVGLCAAI